MHQSTCERPDICEITPDTIAPLQDVSAYELILPSITSLTENSILCLRNLTAPQLISLPAVGELTPAVALELANGFRAQLQFAGIKQLNRNTLRALCCWKRGWISFPNIQFLDADAEHFELALHCGNLSIVRLLIDSGQFSPNHIFRNRSVPILIAGQHLNASLIRLLIEKGANPNSQSHKDGDTLLHMVCRSRSNGLISFLLEHADRTLRNLNNRLPIDEYEENDPLREKLIPRSPPTSY